MENIKDNAFDIVNKLYPDVEMVILTGSAIREKDFTSFSDIDLVLIDNRFSEISTEVTHVNGYRVDFTKLDILLPT